MKKLYLLTFIFISLITYKAYAGPTGAKAFDPLINSYLTAVELSKDGNITAINNKKVIFSFLNREQRQVVENINYLNLNKVKFAAFKSKAINFEKKSNVDIEKFKAVKPNQFVFF